MQTYTQNRRRMQPQVESLEGKTLLSTGSMMHQAVPHVTAAPIVAHATAAFSGTLTGPYSSVPVPFFPTIQSYATSGTLSGAGSTRLLGTLFVRPGVPVGRLVGQLLMRNNGGSMIVNVFQSASPAVYSYKVVLANGADTAFKGGTGTLVITQNPTFTSPFFSSGQATMTFGLG